MTKTKSERNISNFLCFVLVLFHVLVKIFNVSNIHFVYITFCVKTKLTRDIEINNNPNQTTQFLNKQRP